MDIGYSINTTLLLGIAVLLRDKLFRFILFRICVYSVTTTAITGPLERSECDSA